MDVMEAPARCFMCSNSTKHIVFLSTEKSQKIFATCFSYVKDSINIKLLIQNINENNNKISCCKQCLVASLRLTHFVDQLEELKNTIAHWSSNFSDNIASRRNRATARENNDQHRLTNRKQTLNSREQPDQGTLLSDLPIDNENDKERNSNVNFENTDHLMHNNSLSEFSNVGGEIVKREINSDSSIKNENSEDYYEDTNLIYIDEESKSVDEDNLSVNENDNVTDPLQQDDCDLDGGIVKTEDTDRNGRLANSDFTSKAIDSPSLKNNAITRRASVRLSKIPENNQHGTDLHGKSTFIKIGGIGTSNKKFTIQKSHKKTTSKQRRRFSRVCEYCNKTFKAKNQFIIHVRTHTGERPYVCSICANSFSRQTTLDIHYMTHTGERPFNCTQCDKSFTQQSKLNIHKRIHSGERPFKCLYCEKSYRCSIVRLRHQRKIHGHV